QERRGISRTSRHRTAACGLAQFNGRTLASPGATRGGCIGRRTSGNTMNAKRKPSRRKESVASPWQATYLLLRELVRRLGPPADARRHFDVARIEFLKGLRAVLDARIAHISKASPKGEKINIE